MEKSQYRGERDYQDHQDQTSSQTAILENLIDQYETAITQFAFTYVKDWGAAQDITQEVFIKVYGKLESFQQRSSMKTWLFSITANQCKDFLRVQESRKRKLTSFIQRVFTHQEEKTPEDMLQEKHQNASLAQDVLALPVKYREIIILYYYEELNTNEIAALLDQSPSTIRTKLDRARKQLKELNERRAEA
ncbi:RNA polymerase sigma-70 factor (ECF subfamily) [Falsibacillus pallidus]|uniref:RNA polymerase sigma factor n=2 Tax=Falsibacillus pallidus TaxID=493781 RepID=A0A370GD54_9BACI|nr:RNA polymerase sigma-70 factor (ECF subfamily) [Falsibacillus pallidus]